MNKVLSDLFLSYISVLSVDGGPVIMYWLKSIDLVVAVVALLFQKVIDFIVAEP